MNDSKLRLTWRVAVLWYLTVIVVCFVGTYFAYNGPLSSNAWRTWSGAGAWKRDALRAVVGSMLALFVVWNLRILVPRPSSWKETRQKNSWVSSGSGSLPSE